MKKHGSAPLIETGQFAELGAAVLRKVPRDITPAVAQRWIDNPRALGKALRKALILEIDTSPVSTEDVPAYWQDFYEEVFDIGVNLAGLRIPEYQSGFDRLVVIAKGFTLNRVIQACREQFRVHSYWGDNLDGRITKNDRTPEGGPYAIRIRSSRKPDEQLKNLSAKQLQKQGIAGITLLERLVAELDYFKRTSDHLDINSVTLCSGSCASDGTVPSVQWSVSDKLFVNPYGPSSFGGILCARAVVA